MSVNEERDGVRLTNLDQPLFDGEPDTKQALVDYLDAMSDRLVAHWNSRPLSVIRVRPGQPPFMQKNLPTYTPDWIPREVQWAEASKREIAYPLANDRRTLLWLANQRAVEYHLALFRTDAPDRPTELVLDIDPPEGAAFAVVVTAARLVRHALADAGLRGAVKTSGAKGLHVVVPIIDSTTEQAAAATRALAARTEQLDPSLATTAFVRDERAGKVFIDATRAGGATVAAVYGPRLRPGLPVSFPVGWDELDDISPHDFTLRNVVELTNGRDPWAEALPAAQSLRNDLIEAGRLIPVARVQAMHEGRRRALKAARRVDTS